MKYFLFFVLIVSLLIPSCDWDSDIDQIPEWKATWLIVEDSSTGVRWIRVDSLSIQESAASIQPVSIDAEDDHLWSVNSDGSISMRATETGDIEENFSLPSGTAVDLAIGLNQLYISGTDSAVHFLDLKKKTWNRLQVNGLPGLIETRSDRGYVVVNDTVVFIIQEQAFTPRDTIFYSLPITSLHNDPEFYTFLFHQPSPEVLLSRINYHDQVFQFIERPIEESNRLINPASRAIYGKEYIGDIAIENGCLLPEQIVCGDQFWPIWEEGMLLVLRTGELFRHDLFTGELVYEYGQFQGRITDGENIIK